MSDTLRGYREWLRLQLGCLTPLAAGLPGASEGDEPEWQRSPSNYELDHHIRNACRIVNQHVGLGDTGAMRGLAIDAQTATGPYAINLGAVPGFTERSVISIRRAWWNDGTTMNKLDPQFVETLDLTNDAYYLSQPAVPRRFWIKGYTLWLDPPPSTGGTFQYMGSCGVLYPTDENEGFDQIPADYDPCILYIAVVDYGKSLPSNAEMSARAQAFTPDASAGLERLGAWFRGASNEEAQPTVFFDARSMRRGRRRR